MRRISRDGLDPAISRREGVGPLRPAAKRGESDSGDTLIEILVAITILGLTGVALLGAFASDLTGASVYKNTSTIEAVLKNFAEDATFEIQYQASPLFAVCAPLTGSATSSGTTMSYNGSRLAYLPPSGFTVTANPLDDPTANPALGIQYFYQNTSFSTSCDGNASQNQGEPQLITVEATGPHGANGTLSFVVGSFQNETYVQPS